MPASSSVSANRTEVYWVDRVALQRIPLTLSLRGGLPDRGLHDAVSFDVEHSQPTSRPAKASMANAVEAKVPVASRT